MNFAEGVKTVMHSPEMLEEITGREVQRLEPLAGGAMSPVYQLRLADGHNLVLKFGEDKSTLRTERLFLERWSEAGIRTPEVYKLGTSSPGMTPLFYLLMEYLPGANLFPLMESGRLHNPDILRELGRILAQMHGCCAAGYGEVQFGLNDDSRQISGKWSTLAEALASSEWADVIKVNQMNNDLCEQDFALIEQAIVCLNQQRAGAGSHYLHNDFRAGNIIYAAEASDPYAVIDPGPEFGHPYLCLAYSLLLEEIHGSNDPADFRRGYEEISPIDDGALHAALFLRSLTLLPRWGKSGQAYSKPLHLLFRREKTWVRENLV